MPARLPARLRHQFVRGTLPVGWSAAGTGPGLNRTTNDAPEVRVARLESANGRPYNVSSHVVVDRTRVRSAARLVVYEVTVLRIARVFQGHRRGRGQKKLRKDKSTSLTRCNRSG